MIATEHTNITETLVKTDEKRNENKQAPYDKPKALLERQKF